MNVGSYPSLPSRRRDGSSEAASFLFERREKIFRVSCAEKEGVTTTNGNESREGKERRKEKRGKETSRPDTSAINPFRCETFESESKFRWRTGPRTGAASACAAWTLSCPRNV